MSQADWLGHRGRRAGSSALPYSRSSRWTITPSYTNAPKGSGGRQLVTHETSFPFYWLIPGAVAGLAVAGALVWLAARTRGRTRWLLVAGVSVLLGCALGLEAVQGVFMADQNQGVGFVLTYHVEELGENVAALLLLAAALSAVSLTREDGGLAVAYWEPAGRQERAAAYLATAP